MPASRSVSVDSSPNGAAPMEDDPQDNSSALRDAVKKLVAEANTNTKIRIAKQSVSHMKKIVVRWCFW